MEKKPFVRSDFRWIYWIPILAVAWIYFSSLSFVPVPWPDDSAFYFPAKDLFAWPPRWVMIPQAPFEPSYREWNFNTMPLLPLLIGIARLVGAGGNHALKLIPLGGWLAGMTFVLWSLRRAGASLSLLFTSTVVIVFDPILRWSSVLVRPESLIGAMGIFILFGTRFGWPSVFRERNYFHPVSFALLTAAYLHFNAIHLVPLVVVLYWNDFRKVLKIGLLTALGLIPWLATIALRPALFVEQMNLQFSRLSGFENPWLNDWEHLSKALLEDMGTPEPWAVEYRWAIAGCVCLVPFLMAATSFLVSGRTKDEKPRWRDQEGTALFGSIVWLLSALYLWHTKAEVWFTHYIHLAFWAWTILVLFGLEIRVEKFHRWALILPALIGTLFFYGQIQQTIRLEATRSWHWSTYDRWIGCIEGILTDEYLKRGEPANFHVWDPTYPDITIALSHLHPGWEFTRTNDFYSRADLAVAHGYAVDAVVVPEIFRPDDQTFRGETRWRPEFQSVWMNWRNYFLIRLERDPKFKPRRFLCQDGRWDAFIYLNE